MSKIVISKTANGICVSRDGEDLQFFRPGHTASAEALLAIFDELQVDGVAVIERPKAEPRTHIQSEDYVEGVSGWRIDLADGSIKMFKKNVSISAVDTRAVFTQKPLKDREPDAATYAPLPFIVQADKFYISGARISDAVVNIRLSESGSDVGVEEAIKAGKANDILDALRPSIGESQFAASLSANVEAIAKPAQIGEAIAPQAVTNICNQVNHYNDQPLDEGALIDIIRSEIANASKPGGALWSPK